MAILSKQITLTITSDTLDLLIRLSIDLIVNQSNATKEHND